MDDFEAWDAVETAERLRARDVSVKEVVDAAIARAEQRASLGGLVTTTFDRAREHAARLHDVALADQPFAGVPSAVKDLARVAGVRTGWGSRGSFQGPAKQDDPFVKTFNGLGFISLGKSATPELGLTATTEPLGFPPARNPWDTNRTPGGSSGGAAVLVASGILPIAHASDGGGSIRIPAACCGLVGLKPTRGVLDMEGSRLLPVNIATHGVVSRTVRDTATFWAKASGIGPFAPEPATPLRIGFVLETPEGAPVHPEHIRVAEETAKLCESLGHRVEPLANPIDPVFAADFIEYWGFVAWAQARTMKLAGGEPNFDLTRYDPWTEGLCSWFASNKAAGARAVFRLRFYQHRFLDIFKRFDVLLSPTLAQPPPELGHLAPEVPFEVQRQRLRKFVPFTPPYNATGAPALSLPLGRDAKGFPIGVHFGANRGNERALLELAHQLEAAAPWPKIAPRS